MPVEHRRALIGQMLLDAGAEAEMRTLGVDQDAAQIRVVAKFLKRFVQRGDHGGIEHIRLRPVEPQPQ